MTSNAGALLLREADRGIGLSRQVAACFTDGRRQDRIEHSVETLVAQRIHGIALGYEDLNDHDELRHDPVLGLVSGKAEARRSDWAVLAGKSTLNRLEHAPKTDDDRYRKLCVDNGAMKRLFVNVFLKSHATPPKRIILDLDAPDDSIHGEQEGRFFHGYYKCYCYLPLYIFCSRHLLLAKLRPANIGASAGAKEEIAFIVAQIRQSWPNVDIWLRADSGFCREELMAWCEAHGVHYVFGLARNPRLEASIADELAVAEAKAKESGKAERLFKELRYQTLTSWSRERRVVAKASSKRQEPALHRDLAHERSLSSARALRDNLLRPRRDGEPHQGMPARSLRGPDLGGELARQPAEAVVCLARLCARDRLAPHGFAGNRARAGHRGDHPAQTLETWRSRHRQRSPRQDRHRLGLPLKGVFVNVHRRLCSVA